MSREAFPRSRRGVPRRSRLVSRGPAGVANRSVEIYHACTPAPVLSGHKKRRSPPICTSHLHHHYALTDQAYVRFYSTDRAGPQLPGSEKPAPREQGCANSGTEGLAPAILARDSGLSGVTDRSHHWSGAPCRQIIHGLKCFGKIPRRMPFLGAEAALPCVGGRQVGSFPRRWRGPPKQAGLLGEEIPSGIGAVLRAPTSRATPSPRRLRIGPT
jgi:hypothetical protein